MKRAATSNFLYERPFKPDVNPTTNGVRNIENVPIGISENVGRRNEKVFFRLRANCIPKKGKRERKERERKKELVKIRSVEIRWKLRKVNSLQQRIDGTTDEQQTIGVCELTGHIIIYRQLYTERNKEN